MSSELVSLISDIAIGTSAIFVAVMAFLGLQTWRKELTGKAKFDLAHDLMLTGFKLKAHSEDARNPFTYLTESAGRSRQEDETPNVSQVLDEWYAKASRLKPLQEDLIKIQVSPYQRPLQRIDAVLESFHRRYIPTLKRDAEKLFQEAQISTTLGLRSFTKQSIHRQGTIFQNKLIKLQPN